MIKAEISGSLEGFAVRLAHKAAAIASARIASRQLARRDDPRRWRRPGLLWPLFAKG
ncbi:MAG: hypothetical protein KUG65_13045 [Sphingomonadaceae bacterium]|nr:hypothetical protein [Sphingomonadaceae bacterium]